MGLEVGDVVVGVISGFDFSRFVGSSGVVEVVEIGMCVIEGVVVDGVSVTDSSFLWFSSGK